jgi:hypothetical protein
VKPAATILFALLALQVTPVGAEIYRYVDANGNERFTADLHEVPVDQRGDASGDAASRGTLNGGFSHESPSAPNAPSPNARPQAPASQAPSGERVAGRDEAAWRRDRATLVTRIESLETHIATCEKVEAPKPQMPDARRRDWRQDERRMDIVQGCQHAKSDLGAAELALANFDEHARTQGVPPGWLR